MSWRLSRSSSGEDNDDSHDPSYGGSTVKGVLAAATAPGGKPQSKPSTQLGEETRDPLTHSRSPSMSWRLSQDNSGGDDNNDRKPSLGPLTTPGVAAVAAEPGDLSVADTPIEDSPNSPFLLQVAPPRETAGTSASRRDGDVAPGNDGVGRGEVVSTGKGEDKNEIWRQRRAILREYSMLRAWV